MDVQFSLSVLASQDNFHHLIRIAELSFTGEGEALLNWRATTAVCAALSQVSPDFNAVRYCFSGLGAGPLLSKLHAGPYPMRLQFSLHAARQVVREQLVPRSAPLCDVLVALRATAERFCAIELNVVLQDGVNDSDEDWAALSAWGDPAWPILLNPLLSDGREIIASRTTYFAEQLQAAGREVKRYARIGEQISRQRIYPLMSARLRA